MRIKARFTGQPSLGYETGKEYVLSIRISHSYRAEGHVLILDTSREASKGQKCPYDSLRKFLDNWEVL